MSRRTASWACLLGLFATSCDLWSAYRSADPKNCVLSPNICSAREFCGIETERCQSSDSDPAGLRLDSISPPTGPNAGDIVVSLIGSGLATVQQVIFDGRDAMILGSDGKTLQVRLPAHPGKTGYVPVVVRSAAGQIQRDTLFSYHNGSLSFGAGTTGSITIPLPNPLHSFDVADAAANSAITTCPHTAHPRRSGLRPTKKTACGRPADGCDPRWRRGVAIPSTSA